MYEGWRVQKDLEGHWTARVYVAFRCVWFNFGYKSARAAKLAAEAEFERLKPLEMICLFCGAKVGQECTDYKGERSRRIHLTRIAQEKQSR